MAISIKKIAVLTTGGDAPGMNAAIRSVVRYGIYKKIEVMGVFRGWQGLINEDLKLLGHHSVSGIINQGGTILKTARCKEFHTQEGQERAYETLRKNSIDGLVVIGGDGSFRALHEFYKKYKVPCIGIPASIDNDINGIDETIGLDTAINTALAAIDNIRDTATSLERIFVVEVMGRECGYIALEVALAGGCEEVIIPEKKFDTSTSLSINGERSRTIDTSTSLSINGERSRTIDLEAICHDIVQGNLRGKVSWIIVVAEGAASAVEVAKKINDITTLETRPIVLGHVQRGGRPTASSRLLALRLGQAAVDFLLEGKTDKAVSLKDDHAFTVDLEFAIKKKEFNIDNLYRLIKILT